MLDHLLTNAMAEVVLCVCRQDDSGVDNIFPSLLRRARELDIPCLQPIKINSPSVIAAVERLDADLVLSLQNNMIFGDKWVNLFDRKLGIANVHYAPLPRYAGFWPEMWAIWNSEKEFAVTLHYVNSGVDTGPIIAQKSFDILKSDNRKSLYDKSSAECFQMLLETLPRMLAGKLDGRDQDPSLRTYYPKSLPNNGVLDLEWDADTQMRFIRAIAFPGFPGPKITINNQTYTILAEDIPFFKKISTNSSLGTCQK